MRLLVQDLTQESLAGIGRLLTKERQNIRNSVEEFSYCEFDRDLQLDGPLSSGLLECFPRNLILARMEQHLHTRELLISLEGDAVICLAPPQKKPLAGVVALRMLAGQSIILEIGAWHWIPFPTTGQTARYQVIFRSGTGENDLALYDFHQPFDIEQAALI